MKLLVVTVSKLCAWCGIYHIKELNFDLFSSSCQHEDPQSIICKLCGDNLRKILGIVYTSKLDLAGHLPRYLGYHFFALTSHKLGSAIWALSEA